MVAEKYYFIKKNAQRYKAFQGYIPVFENFVKIICQRPNLPLTLNQKNNGPIKEQQLIQFNFNSECFISLSLYTFYNGNCCTSTKIN